MESAILGGDMYKYLQDKRTDPFRNSESLIDLFVGSHIGEIQVGL